MTKITKLIALASWILGKWSSANEPTQRLLQETLRECLDAGAAPLGYRPCLMGGGANSYYWLVFDTTKMEVGARSVYMKSRTPPGCTITVIVI
ncbi:MAG: hypothetical protein PHT12_03120 [Patescibacteria group bacterium]|nr:hypothetical protein [Patescibacteria group bacterium]